MGDDHFSHCILIEMKTTMSIFTMIVESIFGNYQEDNEKKKKLSQQQNHELRQIPPYPLFSNKSWKLKFELNT